MRLITIIFTALALFVILNEVRVYNDLKAVQGYAKQVVYLQLPNGELQQFYAPAGDHIAGDTIFGGVVLRIEAAHKKLK